jgi:hypothetical protein
MGVDEILQRLKLFVNLLHKKAYGSINYDPFDAEMQELSKEQVVTNRTRLSRVVSWLVNKQI